MLPHFQTVNLENDDILADILGEINEVKPKPIGQSNGSHSSMNGTKLLLNRKKNSDDIVAKQYMQSFSNNSTTKKSATPITKSNGNTSDDELLNSIIQKSAAKPTPKLKATIPAVEKTVIKSLAIEKELNKRETIQSAPDIVKETISEAEMKEIEKSITNEMFEPFVNETPAAPLEDDDLANLDFSIIDEAEAESARSVVETPENLAHNKLEELSDKFFLTGWNNARPTGDLNQSIDTRDADDTRVDLSEKSDMKFWYWDAWEDASIRPGEICLFGRMLNDKISMDPQSVCVHVKNIEKCLFLLPREHFWDSKTKQMTDKPVSLMDVYNEFNEKIAPELGVGTFLTRKALKKYPFTAPDGIEVPEVCEYLEVRMFI